MTSYTEKYRGIHPGRVLEREFKKRSLKQRPFALSIDEHPQTLNAITKGRRGLNTALALKIEEKLGLEEGSLVLLQAFYDIKKEKEGQRSRTPNFKILRKSLFWDTDIESIDWDGQYKAVIRRVLERGNVEEREEISRFYGDGKVTLIAKSINKIATSL
ncbi:plasmid maintenance system antidote protein [Muricauda oceani]|uniref:Plasmid maintenance system antidote protein n=1 Tax=Flagellimonas oceani TaxID=2698672 RepID=A0A6G7IZW6_9FLAO|nr:helix-turn-helix domain-containing protein [Allomuricauda oceani]MBW8244825.1 plasmid maintenance system antidote protein [Allomuricauda oceani]QII43864.1 plasmid maintenance system antidote protein [Allomuricauda oceani]